MIVGQAVEDGYIESHKRPNIRSAGKGEFAPRILTVAEARAIEAELAKNPDPQMRLIFVSLEKLGVRISELRGIRWQDIDFQESTVRITKSKSAKGIRTLYVVPELLAEWEAWRQVTPYAHDEDFLFTNSTGTSYRPDRKKGYYAAFHRACRKIGIEEHVRPGHDVRATFITEAIKSGASAPAVMYMAGHESFATTKLYADLADHDFEEEMRKVAERRSGGLRLIEGGEEAEESSIVQEARS
jgi:integrase